jgi:hypothetical protein
MPKRITDPSGEVWEIVLTGRTTQYTRDEISLTFVSKDPSKKERRYARFSPRGAKSAELAFEQVSDRMLQRLLARAQPSWTAPDGGYLSNR